MAYDIGTLPELSRRALLGLHDRLHEYEGESGKENRGMCYSSLEGHELARDLGVSPQSAGGALACLTEEGLAWVEDTDVNGRKCRFLHLTEEGFLAAGCPAEDPDDETEA
ncbi:MAG: hypothetical protein Q7U75_03690 [Desulfobacterales bacterium]|nr:hypothetical protein [Desulfobacterales bacterium]